MSFKIKFDLDKTEVFAFTVAVIGFVLWIASASVGVQSMHDFHNAAESSQASNVDDLNAISGAIYTGQAVSVAIGCVLAVVFGVVLVIMKNGKSQQTSGNKYSPFAMACLIASAFAIVMGIATSSAIIDGNTDLAILSANASPSDTDMVTATASATVGPITTLVIGVLAATAIVIAAFMHNKSTTPKKEK